MSREQVHGEAGMRPTVNTTGHRHDDRNKPHLVKEEVV
jgi:hypothetical protein